MTLAHLTGKRARQAAKELLRKYGQAGTTAFRAVHNEGNTAGFVVPPPGRTAAAGYPPQYSTYAPAPGGYPPQGYPGACRRRKRGVGWGGETREGEAPWGMGMMAIFLIKYACFTSISAPPCNMTQASTGPALRRWAPEVAVPDAQRRWSVNPRSTRLVG